MTTPEQKVEEIITKVVENKKPKVQLTDAEKEAYYVAFKTDKPYTDKIPLFNGKLDVVFRGLYIEEQEAIFEQVSKDEASGINTTSAAYMNRIQFFRLVSSIVSVGGVPFSDSADTLEHKVDKLQKLPVTKVFALNQAFVRFEDKVEALSTAVLDENF